MADEQRLKWYALGIFITLYYWEFGWDISDCFKLNYIYFISRYLNKRNFDMLKIMQESL